MAENNEGTKNNSTGNKDGAKVTLDPAAEGETGNETVDGQKGKEKLLVEEKQPRPQELLPVGEGHETKVVEENKDDEETPPQQDKQ